MRVFCLKPLLAGGEREAPRRLPIGGLPPRCPVGPGIYNAASWGHEPRSAWGTRSKVFEPPLPINGGLRFFVLLDRDEPELRKRLRRDFDLYPGVILPMPFDLV